MSAYTPADRVLMVVQMVFAILMILFFIVGNAAQAINLVRCGRCPHDHSRSTPHRSLATPRLLAGRR